MNLPPGIPQKFAPMFPYKGFNAMQRHVMNDMLQSDRSVVISAPTAAGKTVVMELAIVRALSANSSSGQKPSVVYLCPLKKLCGEKAGEWAAKGQAVGFTCSELTGDSAIKSEYAVLKTTDILCCTTEKFDFLSRRFPYLLESVRLLLVDEVHSISEESRGPVLEAFLTRIKVVRMGSNPPLRIVAVSATIPNVGDISKWLGQDCLNFSFDENHRPVPLDKHVLAFKNWFNNAFQFESSLTPKILEVIEKYSHNKPALIFCISRKCAEESGRYLAKFMPASSDPALTTARFDNNVLNNMIKKAVAFHNAGLSPKDRRAVEQLFSAGKIKALFSTTSLAIGVNLPAHLVVIKSTKFCTGVNGAPVELSDTDFLQMTGRAGRPQFDTRGVVVVMTQCETKQRYLNLCSAGVDLESGLMRRLAETINSELVLGSISSKSGAVDWLKESFLYVRMTKNFAYYRNRLWTSRLLSGSFSYQSDASSSSSQSLASVEEFFTNVVTVAVDDLLEIGVCHLAQEGELVSNKFGKAMAHHVISLKTMRLMIEVLSKNDLDLEDMFDLLSNSQELSSVVLRTEETPSLDAFGVLSRYKFDPDEEVDPKKAKIYVLMQAVLAGEKLTPLNLADDAKNYFRIAQRIAGCFVEIIEIKEPHSLQAVIVAHQFLQLSRSKLWQDSPRLTSQLPGIGPVYSSNLAQQGLITFDQLASASEQQIEDACSRKPPFGSTVKKGALAVPKYALTITEVEPKSSQQTAVEITVQLLNFEVMESKSTFGLKHKFTVIVGDPISDAIFNVWTLTDSVLVRGEGFWRRVIILTERADEITVDLISHEIAGVDKSCTLESKYLDCPLTSTPLRKRELPADDDDNDDKEAVRKYFKFEEEEIKSEVD